MLQARVPVFLLIAFFLLTDHWLERRSPENLVARLRRLLVPLLTWTLIYQSCQVLKYALSVISTQG